MRFLFSTTARHRPARCSRAQAIACENQPLKNLFIAIVILLLIVLHNAVRFWNDNDETLLLGFLPVITPEPSDETIRKFFTESLETGAPPSI